MDDVFIEACHDFTFTVTFPISIGKINTTQGSKGLGNLKHAQNHIIEIDILKGNVVRLVVYRNELQIRLLAVMTLEEATKRCTLTM